MSDEAQGAAVTMQNNSMENLLSVAVIAALIHRSSPNWAHKTGT
ncbi:hypothetical protein RCH21_002520 [Arthrobacter sp. PL16]|nr:hypothetical protein [Arthrobacter sp. PL16]